MCGNEGESPSALGLTRLSRHLVFADLGCDDDEYVPSSIISEKSIDFPSRKINGTNTYEPDRPPIGIIGFGNNRTEDSGCCEGSYVL